MSPAFVGGFLLAVLLPPLAVLTGVILLLVPKRKTARGATIDRQAA